MAAKIHRQLQAFLGERAVLVVEPSTNYRTSLKQFLTNLRVPRVKLVATVAEARRELLTTKVGLFIVEWAIDGENGLQFCRSLRRELAYKETPFLLLTAENLRKDVILASELRVDAYLLKPFSYEDFCAQIEHLIKLQTRPGRLVQLIDLADERMERGDLESAAKMFEQALGLKENSARARTGLARIQRLRGDVEGALRHLTEAVNINPEYIEAYRMMLEIAEERRDRAGMLQAASILHEMSPENPRYTLILAKCYLDIGALEPSEKFFKKTLALSPRLVEAYKGLGNIYLAQEEYEKAKRNFKRALDLDAGDASMLNSLGTAYVRLGQYQEGIDRYMIALKFVPHDSRVLFNIAQAHEKKGDLEKAKWFYAQALLHRPNFEKAQRGIERLEKLTAAGPDDSGSVGPEQGLDGPDSLMIPFKKSS